MKTEKEFPARSKMQNKSIHLFCEQLAETLNDAGYDMKKTLKPSIDIPWTKDSVKKFLWKPIQDTLFNKESTTDLKTNEVTKVHEVLVRHLGERLLIETPPFPSVESNIHE